MVPTLIEVNAVTIPDPHPPVGCLDPDRRMLVAQISVRSPVAPDTVLLLAGEALPTLIAMVQKIIDKFPELTIERANEESVSVTSEEGKTLNLVPGPEGEQ